MGVLSSHCCGPGDSRCPTFLEANFRVAGPGSQPMPTDPRVPGKGLPISSCQPLPKGNQKGVWVL